MSPVARRVLPDAGQDDQLLYFTTASVRDDGQALFFIRDEGRGPDLWTQALDGRGEARGAAARLGDNRDGCLKSYVYFDGTPYRGFGKASVCLDPARGRVFYLQGSELRRVDPSGAVAALAELPPGLATAFTHVSPDGGLVCVPATDMRALDGPLRAGKPAHDIDARVREEGLFSYLYFFDADSGRQVDRLLLQGEWVTHVQFSPKNPDLLLYNNEWPADCGVRRMHLLDRRTGTRRRLRTEGPGRRAADWTCHETWTPDGEWIVYHGQFAGGRAYLGRMRSDGSGLKEIPLPEGWTDYGHFSVSRTQSDLLVSDGYYRDDRGESGALPGGAWISLVYADWERSELRWIPLCRHGSSWSSQDVHPHPVFGPGDDSVWYTSDVEGHRAVYRIPLV